MYICTEHLEVFYSWMCRGRPGSDRGSTCRESDSHAFRYDTSLCPFNGREATEQRKNSVPTLAYSLGTGVPPADALARSSPAAEREHQAREARRATKHEGFRSQRIRPGCVGLALSEPASLSLGLTGLKSRVHATMWCPGGQGCIEMLHGMHKRMPIRSCAVERYGGEIAALQYKIRCRYLWFSLL